jgi:hypothetical protein
VAPVPLPPAVGRAIEQAISDHATGPIQLTPAALERTGTPPPAGCTARLALQDQGPPTWRQSQQTSNGSTPER